MPQRPDHPLPLFNVKGACEAALKDSGLEYTILGPAVFMEIWIGMVVGIPLAAGQPITLIGQGDHRHNPFVSEADVAAFALAAVDHPAARNAEIGIGGPASYIDGDGGGRGQGHGRPLPCATSRRAPRSAAAAARSRS